MEKDKDKAQTPKRRKDEALVKACRELYLSDWAQNQICEALGVAPAVLSRWKREEGWEAERLAEQTTPSKIREWGQAIALYQMESIYKEVEENRKKGIFKPLENGSLDGLHKIASLLSKEVKNKKAYLTIMDEFRSFLLEEDFALAQKTVPIIERFAAVKIKEAHA